MSTQPDLFDEAKQRRDVGMAQAAQAQGIPWSDRAYETIVAIARRQPTVHIDDVLRTGLKADRPNAWGSVWMRAIRKRVICHTGSVQPCKLDPGKHAHRYPVYQSLLYVGRDHVAFGEHN